MPILPFRPTRKTREEAAERLTNAERAWRAAHAALHSTDCSDDTHRRRFAQAEEELEAAERHAERVLQALQRAEEVETGRASVEGTTL